MPDDSLIVIRDDGRILLMIPLFSKLGITRCNVQGCPGRPTTILHFESEGEVVTVGICEGHYQEAERKGRWDYTLDPD